MRRSLPAAIAAAAGWAAASSRSTRSAPCARGWVMPSEISSPMSPAALPMPMCMARKATFHRRPSAPAANGSPAGRLGGGIEGKINCRLERQGGIPLRRSRRSGGLLVQRVRHHRSAALKRNSENLPRRTELSLLITCLDQPEAFTAASAMRFSLSSSSGNPAADPGFFRHTHRRAECRSLLHAPLHEVRRLERKNGNGPALRQRRK